MYQGRFDWSTVLRPPTDVRGYVKEIIMNCIGVHAEVGDDARLDRGSAWWGIAQGGKAGIVSIVSRHWFLVISWCIAAHIMVAVKFIKRHRYTEP